MSADVISESAQIKSSTDFVPIGASSRETVADAQSEDTPRLKRRRATLSQVNPPPAIPDGAISPPAIHEEEHVNVEQPPAHTAPVSIPSDAHICPHIAMLSAARHGSTWFVDSVDDCRYSSHVPFDDMEQEKAEFAADVFSVSELWSIHEGPLRKISPLSAAEYIKVNASVKLLSPHAVERPGSVRSFLTEVKNQGTPVVLLRRDLGDAFASLSEAQKTGNWAAIKRRGRRRKGKPVGEGWKAYRAKMEKYFKDGTGLLREVGVKFDEVWYEDVVGQERIWLENAGCYVRNCNFAQ